MDFSIIFDQRNLQVLENVIPTFTSCYFLAATLDRVNHTVFSFVLFNLTYFIQKPGHAVLHAI